MGNVHFIRWEDKFPAPKSLPICGNGQKDRLEERIYVNRTVQQLKSCADIL